MYSPNDKQGSTHILIFTRERFNKDYLPNIILWDFVSSFFMMDPNSNEIIVTATNVVLLCAGYTLLKKKKTKET